MSSYARFWRTHFGQRCSGWDALSGGGGVPGRRFTTLLFCAATVLSSSAQTLFTTFLNFDIAGWREALFHCPLSRGLDGNLYGNNFPWRRHGLCFGQVGCGTVLRMTGPGGNKANYPASTIRRGIPLSDLHKTATGTFYGTTFSRGANGAEQSSR